eukprot:TRINITY_DN51570_c0_g1_i1.p1 TRINITY_DN51570_c0_g1~~TRINITY_DN51570_c0_g1_i1.p1  ORF type:complete len:198 (+),score=25.49 TRINITY_DN51570_c0_g1_i1:29-595(+)
MANDFVFLKHRFFEQHLRSDPRPRIRPKSEVPKSTATAGAGKPRGGVRLWPLAQLREYTEADMAAARTRLASHSRKASPKQLHKKDIKHWVDDPHSMYSVCCSHGPGPGHYSPTQGTTFREAQYFAKAARPTTEYLIRRDKGPSGAMTNRCRQLPPRAGSVMSSPAAHRREVYFAFDDCDASISPASV